MIENLERLTLLAWPPAERVEYDGWVLGYSGGGTRRTNSAQALAAGHLDLEEKIDYCEEHYRVRRAAAVFKVTSASLPADLDRRLDARGYSEAGHTSVQVLELPSGGRGGDPDVSGRGSVRIVEAPEGTWVDDAIRWNRVGAPDSAPLRSTLERTPQPRAFVEIFGGSESIGQALGILCEETLYVCQVVVAPDHRRRGHARTLMQALLRWSVEREARRAFLQVVVGNGAAHPLYTELGFSELYRYWYRARASVRLGDSA